MKSALVFIAPLVMLCLSSITEASPTYVYTDPQGTPVAEADANGNITATFDHKPYGQIASGTAPDGIGYTGHVEDPDTALVYMQARYYDPLVGRFLSPDPTGQKSGLDSNDYAYAENNPIAHTDPTGLCADHYQDGTCKVNVDSSTGKPGTKAGKLLEGVLNKYDKAVNSLADGKTFTIKDRQGNSIGTLTGKEIKAVWNGTSFNITNKSFNNGGVGGGTGGTWNGDMFKGNSSLTPHAVMAYATAATQRQEAQSVGLNTLTFHELGHETHFGVTQTQKYPVTPKISLPRERAASSAAETMTHAVGATFDCSIPQGCQ